MKDFVLALFVVFIFIGFSFSQDLKDERIVHQGILKVIKSEVEDKYFDLKFGGVDVDESFKNATSSG